MRNGPLAIGTPRVVRVLPDVAAIQREFHYAVPEAWSDDGRAQAVTVGAMVRIDLAGRRVGGWITELDPSIDPGVELRPLAKVSGVGPDAAMIDLARWAAHRWVGSTAALLGTASPSTMVPRVSGPRSARPQPRPGLELTDQAFTGSGAVVRIPPTGDRWPFVAAAVAEGNALILVPSLAQARTVVGRLKHNGVSTALYPRDWARGASGATVVGTRAAAFAPVGDLAAILMIDEHDEVYQEERAPTWHAREVVVERARRSEVPCVVTSPLPTLEAQAALPLLAVSRSDERKGWPKIHVVDPRGDGSARGTLWTGAVVQLLRGGGRVACVLNRKGRSKLLACSNCDQLAVCDQCQGALRQDEPGELVCATQGHRQPVVCSECGGTKFKNLRLGVSRAREELEALLHEPVVEVTGDTDDNALHQARVFVGTEAVLHRIDDLSAVAFVDFDQELVAPRYRAGEEALALLARAGRLVGGRDRAVGEVLVQTRQPGHPVVRAAEAADISSWSSAEATRREMLGYPPFAALAEISGAAAPEFIERLGTPLGLEVRGPVADRWLVRAGNSQILADALNDVERPTGRLRIAVDPLRL